MSSANCCFLTCIQVSQEAGQAVWSSHLFQNFPQCTVIHTVKGFGIVNKAEIDVVARDGIKSRQNLLQLNKELSDPKRQERQGWGTLLQKKGRREDKGNQGLLSRVQLSEWLSTAQWLSYIWQKNMRRHKLSCFCNSWQGHGWYCFLLPIHISSVYMSIFLGIHIMLPLELQRSFIARKFESLLL